MGELFVSLVAWMPACAELIIRIVNGLGETQEMHILKAAAVYAIPHIIGCQVIAVA